MPVTIAVAAPPDVDDDNCSTAPTNIKLYINEYIYVLVAFVTFFPTVCCLYFK